MISHFPGKKQALKKNVAELSLRKYKLVPPLRSTMPAYSPFYRFWPVHPPQWHLFSYPITPITVPTTFLSTRLHPSQCHLFIHSITPIPVPLVDLLDYTHPSATLLPTRLHPFQCHLFTYSITPILFTYSITPILFIYSITPISMPLFYLLDYTHSNATFFIYSIIPTPMPPFYLLGLQSVILFSSSIYNLL